MPLFSWFSSGRRPRPEAKPSVLSDSAHARLEAGRAAQGAHPGHHGHAPQRKQERVAHREQLYAVVREAMVRAGVLSSSYKFKVLSLDGQGRQFMVMVDLVHGTVGDTSRLAEIEAVVAQSALAKYDIQVTAVYWRANEHVVAGDVIPRMPAAASRPAPLESPSRPAPMEPLQPDEVAAFRKALDAGMRGERALAAAGAGKPPQNYTLLTGFEDTEMVPDENAAQQLSATQYGALR